MFGEEVFVMRCLRVAGAFASALLATVLAAGQEPTFPAVLFTATGKYPDQVSAAYGDFTLAGPKADALKPLPRGIRHVAYDPVGKQLYGITNHELCRLDLAKGEGSEIAFPADLPRLSWPSGIAFDTKRERVVVAGGGAVGSLYSFTPKTGGPPVRPVPAARPREADSRGLQRPRRGGRGD